MLYINNNVLHHRLLVVVLLLILISCGKEHKELDQEEYYATIEQWQQERLSSLKKSDSWLSLAGLYKLDEGTQTIGSNPPNDIIFPQNTPPELGSITRNGNNFIFTNASGVNVMSDGKEVHNVTLNIPEEDHIEFRHGSLLWYIIERRGTYFLRLKDTNHLNFTQFKGMEYFPINQDWRIEANFHSFE